MIIARCFYLPSSHNRLANGTRAMQCIRHQSRYKPHFTCPSSRPDLGFMARSSFCAAERKCLAYPTLCLYFRSCYSQSALPSIPPPKVTNTPLHPLPPQSRYTHLPASAPHALQESISLCQSVDAVVTLAHLAHEAAERKDVVLAGVAAVVVDLCDGDLDRGVVLGFDDAVCGGALAGDVTMRWVGG